MTRWILIVVILAATILLFRRWRSSALFRIQIRSNHIDITGRVPGYGNSDVRQFITELGLPNGSLIKGVPSRERYQLEFSASVPELQRQRIRNYFYLKLS